MVGLFDLDEDSKKSKLRNLQNLDITRGLKIKKSSIYKAKGYEKPSFVPDLVWTLLDVGSATILNGYFVKLSP